MAAGDHYPYTLWDIRNKSDQCVVWKLPEFSSIGGELHPGQTYEGKRSLRTELHASIKVTAQVEDCRTQDQIGVERYDYIPIYGHSELSIHGAKGNYIMRHGP